MTTHIDASILNQGNIGNPNDNNRYIKYAIDFGTDPLQFDFPSGASTLLSFGVPKCIFIDNQNNLYALSITVTTTNQSFPVPAQSAGYYYLDAVVGSNIIVTPASDPTGVVTFVFYNFDRSPVVWYKTNVTTSAVTIADGADAALGATTDAEVTNPALPATLISLAKGILDNTGGGGSTGPNVNLTKVAGAATKVGAGTASGALRVELPTDGTGKVGLNAGSNIIGKVGIDQTTPGTTNGVQVNAALPAGNNNIGDVDIASALPAGTNTIGNVNIASPYPANATFVSGDSGNQANASAVATLAGAIGKATYLTGFAVTASGATAANVVTVTVAGVLGGTKNYTFVFPAGVTTAAEPLIITFDTPLVSSASNTAIVVTLPASGAGGTNATVTAEGYQL